MTGFLRSLAKLAALVLAAGAIGVALGTALVTLSSDGEPARTEPAVETQPTVETPTAAASAPATQGVRVSVIGARLFTDEAPSGDEEQRGRMTVRVRAQNAIDRRVTLKPPILRVGSVRIAADDAGAQLGPLAAGATQTVTLRFALAGEATPKVVRDRRARILIAGQSLPMRVKVRAPST